MGRCKSQQFPSPTVVLDEQPVPRKGLPAHNVTQFESEPLEGRKARRFGMQVAKLEPPSVRLAARVLANDAIKPALQAARQRKVSAVDRQHERIVQDRPIEPVWHDQVDSVGISMGASALCPFIDPGEGMDPAFADPTERMGGRWDL